MNQRMVVRLVMLIGFFTLPTVSLAQGTWVECPGTEGRVMCTENQVAICWVGDSVSSERCLTPPGELAGLSLDLWLLSYVFDDTLTVTDESIESYREIIRKGKWECSMYQVSFSLPGGWKGTR